ncbi:hypothetical protein CALVIDRAFT_166965 [Calocera viscosa TUFC12733]|uniref:Uncharacterized protein n=1 Tax=Calocera viscosa (strain TUFC12733) TaxID=1330018 RepID=A0A167L4T7_CALVF|nr:hypothetical protein CALVIDRAFT_166965 [Calocera viscosa TUFC12733]
MTGSELSAWITKAGETTDMPATLPQLTLAERMVEAGAPNADQLQEGMTWRAMTDWLNHAKKYTSYTPGKALPKGRDRDHLASETAKQLARRLSTSCGLQLPYDEYYANKGEVSDFILACRAELMRQGKPAFSPSDEEKNLPATEGQRFKLRTLGVELPEDATREQASDRIIQAQKEGGMTLGPPIQRENVQKARWWGLRTSSSTQKEDPQEPYTPWKSPQQH